MARALHSHYILWPIMPTSVLRRRLLESTVSSKVTGRIVDVLVEKGMTVTEGSILARLDNTTERSYLALAELDVRHEEVRLDFDRQCRLLDQRLMGQADLDAAIGRGGLARGADRQPARAGGRGRARDRRATDPPWRTLSSAAPFSGVAVSTDAQPGEMISPVSAGGGFIRTGVCTIVETCRRSRSRSTSTRATSMGSRPHSAWLRPSTATPTGRYDRPA